MILINGKVFDFGESVSVVLHDGKTFGGVLMGFYPADETYSEHDEIEIDEHGVFRTLELEDISSIEVVEAAR